MMWVNMTRMCGESRWHQGEMIRIAAGQRLQTISILRTDNEAVADDCGLVAVVDPP
jgi:hypothetical protein